MDDKDIVNKEIEIDLHDNQDDLLSNIRDTVSFDHKEIALSNQSKSVINDPSNIVDQNSYDFKNPGEIKPDDPYAEVEFSLPNLFFAVKSFDDSYFVSKNKDLSYANALYYSLFYRSTTYGVPYNKKIDRLNKLDDKLGWGVIYCLIMMLEIVAGGITGEYFCSF